MNDTVSAKVQSDAKLAQEAAQALAAAGTSSNAGAAITLLRAEAATVFGLSPITAGATIEHFPNNVTHQAPQEATRAATVVIPLGLALQTALRALLIGQVTICVLTLSSNTCYMKKRVLFMSAGIRTSGQKHQLSRINRG